MKNNKKREGQAEQVITFDKHLKDKHVLFRIKCTIFCAY